MNEPDARRSRSGRRRSRRARRRGSSSGAGSRRPSGGARRSSAPVSMLDWLGQNAPLPDAEQRRSARTPARFADQREERRSRPPSRRAPRRARASGRAGRRAMPATKPETSAAAEFDRRDQAGEAERDPADVVQVDDQERQHDPVPERVQQPADLEDPDVAAETGIERAQVGAQRAHPAKASAGRIARTRDDPAPSAPDLTFATDNGGAATPGTTRRRSFPQMASRRRTTLVLRLLSPSLAALVLPGHASAGVRISFLPKRVTQGNDATLKVSVHPAALCKLAVRDGAGVRQQGLGAVYAARRPRELEVAGHRRRAGGPGARDRLVWPRGPRLADVHRRRLGRSSADRGRQDGLLRAPEELRQRQHGQLRRRAPEHLAEPGRARRCRCS